MSEKPIECEETNCNSDCEHCPSAPDRAAAPQDFHAPANAASHVKRVIGVVSGKGGVGKSMVTSLLAAAFKRAGYRSAVLDADITGPSIPKMFGIKGRAKSGPDGILPSVSAGGIGIMSVNLLLENEDDPVVWRGPIISGTVKQFWTEVSWGDVDFMMVDMPPGTGDVPLTVFQSLPIDGIVVVTSPQELVSMIVKKAFHMAQMMKIPVLGVVENMSFYRCPDCGREEEIFGKSHLPEVAAELGLEVLGRIPLDPKLAALSDAGKIEEASGVLDQTAALLAEKLNG